VADLVELANRFVSLSTQLEETRNLMRQALANGAGVAPVRPTPAGGKPGKMSRAETVASAKEAEREIAALLKERPMRTAEIAAATSSRTSTASERLRKLSSRGAVQRDPDGTWSLSSTPAS
jgi:hypothetical protein